MTMDADDDEPLQAWGALLSLALLGAVARR